MPRLGTIALSATLAAVFTAAPQSNPGRDGAAAPALFPGGETLSFRIEWRFIHAGNARLTMTPSNNSGGAGWSARMHLESAGLVSRLYKIDTDYSAELTESLCMVSSLLTANEGARRRETSVTFDAARRKANTVERDLVKNQTARHEIDTGPCEHDSVAALFRLRALELQPGHSAEIPVSDGKKAVLARVEAQERETITTDFGKFNTVRYEAFLFNDVLYRRKGRLFVWLTDDERRLPVQIRIRLPIYVGTVTLQLEKEGKA